MRYFKFLFVICLAAAVVMLATGYRIALGPVVIILFASLALYFGSHPFLKSFAFTAWVFAFVAASMVYPAAFMTWFGFDLGVTIVPLIQIIMFGMGTTLSVADFVRVFKMPWPVFVGFFLQYSVMPFVGFTLAKAFGFDAQVAAGVVLIGSAPGGVASNVMTYLAGGDVPLSVTMTSCSTLVSPVMTPFWMKVLAGQFVPVNFFEMMFSIINMIIVPIVAGLLANRILYSRRATFEQARGLALIAAAGILLAVGVGLFAPSAVLTYGGGALRKDGFVVGSLLIGVVALTKLVIGVLARLTAEHAESAETKNVKGVSSAVSALSAVKSTQAGNWMDKTLPVISMAGICLIIAIITARSRDDLMAVGPILIGAAIMHNLIGYILGYWLARAVRLDQIKCRTIAIEVGMQNGGMASALAMNVLKSPQAALAPAIFGPWMNVSGSILATWWRRKKSESATGGAGQINNKET